MQTIADLPTVFTATSRASTESQVDEAMTIAKAKALHEGRRGILVIQHDGEDTEEHNAGLDRPDVITGGGLSLILMRN